MKTSLVPWLLAGGGLAGLLYLATRPSAIAAAPSTKRPAATPSSVPILGPGTVTTHAPGVPGQTGTPAPTPAPQSVPPFTTSTAKEIARLLSPGVVERDPAIYETYARIAAGPDGTQHPELVLRLHAKAYLARLAQRYQPQAMPTQGMHRGGATPV